MQDCSVCSENYVASLGFTCRECSDNVISIAITVVLSVLAVAFGMAIVSVLMSFETEGAGRGFVYRVTQWIPKQSLKIIIVTWQILTQVRVEIKAGACNPEPLVGSRATQPFADILRPCPGSVQDRTLPRPSYDNIDDAPLSNGL